MSWRRNKKLRYFPSVNRRGLMVCLLCVSTWRGPIPVVHEHSLEMAALANNLSLARHALQFHTHEFGHGETDWHLHFVMPEDLLPLGGCNDVCLPENADPSIGCTAITAFVVSAWRFDDSRATISPMDVIDDSSSAAASIYFRSPPVPWNGFLQSMCGCADSRAVLCIALC